MASPRFVFTTADFVTITEILSERKFQGAWSHPDVPVLIFADSGLGGTPVTNHGGNIGSGLPIEALFWGDWWLSPEGTDRRTMIIDRLNAVIASPYFSELAQYGVALPRWREARVVIEPGPPAAFNSSDDYQVVPDLIDSLIDDDVFPDPEDERIAHLVFMPKGFIEGTGNNGAHTSDYNYTPFDYDTYWVGWVRWFDDINTATLTESREDVIRTATHELVELMSDPEGDAWYADPIKSGEIGDIAVSGGTKQVAFVNGAKVQAYWSNRHGATIIPIDRDYSGLLTGSITSHHTGTETGTFRPDPGEGQLCDLLPSCCFADQDYAFSVNGYDEKAVIRATTTRYRLPRFTWSVGGKPVSGSGSVLVSAFTERYVGRKPRYQTENVTITFTVANDTLELRTKDVAANFDVTVDCAINDTSIEGNLKTDVVARPRVDVGFQSVKLTLDPAYQKARAACEKDATKMFVDNIPKTGRRLPHTPGGPVEIDPAVLSSVPAYFRLAQFETARKAVAVAQAASLVLPAAAARSLAASLVADTPALRAAVARRKVSATAR